MNFRGVITVVLRRAGVYSIARDALLRRERHRLCHLQESSGSRLSNLVASSLSRALLPLKKQRLTGEGSSLLPVLLART